MSLAEIWTVNCVELTNVVVRGLEVLPATRLTTDVLTKPAPLTVRVKSVPPENTVDGEMLEMDGVGLLLTVMCSERDVACCRLPDVPVTVTVNVPVAADVEAARVRVEDALLPAAGVTLTGENVAVTPLGRPEALKALAALNPLRLEMVTVDVPVLPFPPALTVTAVGATLMLKSAGGLATTAKERATL
jgi:hypothetical protein